MKKPVMLKRIDSKKSETTGLLPGDYLKHWFGAHAWREQNERNKNGNLIRHCLICNQREELIERYAWGEGGWWEERERFNF